MPSDERSLENEFLKWLSTKVSPAQLSECYAAVAAVDEFCISRKVLKKKLLETTDVSTIVKVRDTIEHNKILSFTYRKQRRYLQLLKRYRT